MTPTFRIQAFKVERYAKSAAASSCSFSFFGEQEVVELSTSGLGIVGRKDAAGIKQSVCLFVCLEVVTVFVELAVRQRRLTSSQSRVFGRS